MSSVELYYTTFFEFEQKEDKNLCQKKCNMAGCCHVALGVFEVRRNACFVREAKILRSSAYSVAMNRMNAAFPSAVRL